eukprot:3515521-Amphidinium_carterae.1
MEISRAGPNIRAFDVIYWAKDMAEAPSPNIGARDDMRRFVQGCLSFDVALDVPSSLQDAFPKTAFLKISSSDHHCFQPT